MRAILATAAAVLLASPLLGQRLEFEVGSIKRNLADPLDAARNSGRVAPSGGNPKTGHIEAINVPARALVRHAYPSTSTTVEVIGLPSWADSERYDVVARAKPGASPDELAQMWRALLSERMKLAAHYETRTRSGYNLVLERADRKLGAQLIQAPGDCPKASADGPPDDFRRALSQREPLSAQSERYIVATCGARATVGDTMYAGHIRFSEVVSLLARIVGATVIDRTGLDGRFSLKLTFGQRTSVAPALGGPPSIFTAVEEQLGLKLDAATVEAPVLIIDRIERPTAN